MRSFILIICILGTGEISLAQTNTFPSSGNVGIGTTSPQQPLHIVGNGNILTVENTNGETANQIAEIRIKAGSAKNYIWTNNQNSNNYYGGHGSLNLYTGQNSPIAFFTNGNNERMRINGNGHVGIGIADPSVRLHVSNGNSLNAVARFENSSADFPIFMQTYSNGYSQIQGNLYHNGSDYIRQNSGSGMVIRLLNGNGGLTIASASSGNAGTSASLTDLMTVTNNGSVGIGIVNPPEKLSVNGKIRAREIKVEASSWPDYVFEPEFKLPGLDETEAFIKEYKHLPEIPPAREVSENGIDLGEMNAKLLRKIEELTLYLIKQNKNQEVLVNEVKELKAEINQLKSEP